MVYITRISPFDLFSFVSEMVVNTRKSLSSDLSSKYIGNLSADGKKIVSAISVKLDSKGKMLK